MSRLELKQQWTGHEFGTPEVRSTMAQLLIAVNGNILTKNENSWSRSVQDHVLVSTYPLAYWMLQSWWRLLYEPMPYWGEPNIAWRMAHELGATGNGFVWPKILFASDGEHVQIWATPSHDTSGQSVRYLDGLRSPESVSLPDFIQTLAEFVSTVASRLESVGVRDSDLASLYSILMREQRDTDTVLYRKLEAVLGYDPDMGPDNVMNRAMDLCERYGEETLFELAPVYGTMSSREPLTAVEDLVNRTGIIGSPSFTTARDSRQSNAQSAPWELAVRDAHRLRKEIGDLSGPVDNATLHDLLGVTSRDVDSWLSTEQHDASVGIPIADGKIKYILRKRHPISKRFEMARYIADFIYVGVNKWLTNTDVSTARQKYQRAFAAEFLCPIQELVNFLNGDYSDEAIIDAGYRFNVSERMIESLLANNNYLGSGILAIPPYQMGFQSLGPVAASPRQGYSV